MAKVLLIDDEKQVLDMLCMMLERKGHEVLPASNGEEGLKLFIKEKPDVVVTDLFMDTKDGLGTIMEIKKKDPEAPIIAISGGGWSTGTNYLNVAEKMGVAYTFTKPVSNKQLLEAIEKVVAGNDDMTP